MVTLVALPEADGIGHSVSDTSTGTLMGTAHWRPSWSMTGLVWLLFQRSWLIIGVGTSRLAMVETGKTANWEREGPSPRCRAGNSAHGAEAAIRTRPVLATRVHSPEPSARKSPDEDSLGYQLIKRVHGWHGGDLLTFGRVSQPPKGLSIDGAEKPVGPAYCLRIERPKQRRRRRGLPT